MKETFEVSKNLQNALVEAIKNESNQRSNLKFGLSVSGGPDSMALLWAAHELSEAESDAEFTVIHIDHGVRPESGQDLLFVKDAAERAGFSFVSKKLEGEIPQTGFQQWARNRRIEFCESVAEELGLRAVLLAHHADDQVETFFHNLGRGAGARGLSGMKRRNGLFIRPFLGLKKTILLEYLESENQTYVVDETNLGSDYTRNRLRNELIPQLDRHLPEGWKDRLGNTQKVLSVEDEFLDKLANEADPSVKLQNWREFSRTDFSRIAVTLKRRLLRLWAAELTLGSQLDFETVDKLLDAIEHQTTGVFEGPGGFRLEVSGSWARVFASDQIEQTPLNWSLSFDSKPVGQVLKVKFTPLEISENRPKLKELGFPSVYGEYVFTIRKGEIAELRPRKSSDRWRGKGLKKLYQNAALPHWLRDEIPVVALKDTAEAVFLPLGDFSQRFFVRDLKPDAVKWARLTFCAPGDRAVHDGR